MALDHSLVGEPGEPHERSWTSTDALLHTLCGSDPARFASMSGRFTHPVLPGDSLTISIWVADAATAAGDGPGRDGRARFQTATQDGTVVIDRGVMRFRGA